VERLKQVAGDLHLSLPELALRFILSNPAVTTSIPGMRRVQHVAANVNAGSGDRLAPAALASIREHRWDRRPDDRP